MIPACKEQVEPQQNKALIYFDRFDSIIFGIICHYEHNFDLFSEKSTIVFRTNFDFFQKFTFDFLNLENSGTNLKNTILATWTAG